MAEGQIGAAEIQDGRIAGPEPIFSRTETETGEPAPKTKVLFIDAPFHSNPKLIDKSFKDFAQEQDIPRGALSVASFLSRRHYSTAVVPMDAFVNSEISNFQNEVFDQPTDEAPRQERTDIAQKKIIGEAFFDNMAKRTIDAQIAATDPTVVAISFMFSPTYESVKEMVRYIKETYPDKIVVLGGNAATFEKDTQSEFLGQLGADIFVNQEGEWTFAELIDEIEAHGGSLAGVNLSEIKGISYWNGESVMQTNKRPRGNLSTTGPLEYKLLSLPEGVHLGDFNHYVLFARGCFGRCVFCTSSAMYESSVTSMGLESFSEELFDVAEAIMESGRENKSIGILDDDLLLELNFDKDNNVTDNPAEVARRATVFEVIEPILRQVREKYPEVTFTIQTRVSHLRNPRDDEKILNQQVNTVLQNPTNQLEAMKQSGIDTVFLGIESGSNEILRQCGKDTRVEWVKPACQKLHDAGLAIGAFWIVGLPGSDASEEGKSMEFLRSLVRDGYIDDLEGHIYTPLPGSMGAESLYHRSRIKMDPGAQHESYLSDVPKYDYVDPNSGEITYSRHSIAAYFAETKEIIETLRQRGAKRISRAPRAENYATPEEYELQRARFLKRLDDFEKASWPEEEQADPAELARRFDAFPEGIFIMSDIIDGQEIDVAQVTASPKNIRDPDTINSFTRMRDFPADRDGKVIWITNMAARGGEAFRGKHYASTLMSEVIGWASTAPEQYESIMAGVTCDGYKAKLDSGEVTSIDDYMQKRSNPALNAFKSATRRTGRFSWNSDPIPNYWEEDESSQGYGVMVAVDLPEKDYEDLLFPPLPILERTGRQHYIQSQVEFAQHGRFSGLQFSDTDRSLSVFDVESLAAEAYDTWQDNRYKSLEELNQLFEKLNSRAAQAENAVFLYQQKLAGFGSVEDDYDFSKLATEVTRLQIRIRIIEELILSKEQAEYVSCLHNEKLDIDYSIDLNNTNMVGAETRRTVDGKEQTAFLVTPVHGCSRNCTFCSIKHISNPTFQPTEQAAVQVLTEVDDILSASPNTNTIKLFNGGNILYGTQEEQSAEMHERFIQMLPSILHERRNLKAIEIEVRVDEFVDVPSPAGEPGQFVRGEQKRIIRERVKHLAESLRAQGKELRILLALEYASVDILGESNKGTAISQFEDAINFMRENNIPWLGYAMLGGRQLGQPRDRQQWVNSATETVKYIVDRRAREAIINSQFVDPVDIRATIPEYQPNGDISPDEVRSRVPFYIPTEQDMKDVLGQIAPQLTPERRVRLSIDPEEIIVGTIGPKISQQFHDLVDGFNNAPDQDQYYWENIANYEPR